MFSFTFLREGFNKEEVGSASKYNANLTLRHLGHLWWKLTEPAYLGEKISWVPASFMCESNTFEIMRMEVEKGNRDVLLTKNSWSIK